VRRSVLGLAVALAFLTPMACAGRADHEQYAHLTGVYWFDGESYRVDVTCWNTPGNPQGGAAREIKMAPGGTEMDAPDGWWWSGGLDAIAWYASNRDYWIPQGEWLNGFVFSTGDDPGDVVYEYAIYMDQGPFSRGEFTPEYIPEPRLAAPLMLTILAARQVLRRRRW
jgi:hypothetical protein